jgi:OOP family OmpA-OmpF porin
MRRLIPLIAVFALLLSLAGCRKKRPAPKPLPPPPPTQAAPTPPVPNFVLLLADEDGKTGRIVIRNAAGSVELTQSNTLTRIARFDAAPSGPEAIPSAEVRQRFGPVLDAVPASELYFTLTFLENRDELTPESAARLPDIAKAIQDRRATFVSVTGHTDTTGSAEVNYQLGLRRAERVATILRGAGIPGGVLFIRSHGEGDPAVPTADNVSEARNRRVEVVVR